MSELDRAVAAFAAELRGPRRARSRLVDEVTDHLCDSLDRELAAGTPPEAAERAVLDRFGDPRAPAAAWNRDRGVERRRALVLALAAVAACALAVTQYASGNNARTPPRCAGATRTTASSPGLAFCAGPAARPVRPRPQGSNDGKP